MFIVKDNNIFIEDGLFLKKIDCPEKYPNKKVFLNKNILKTFSFYSVLINQLFVILLIRPF